MELSYVIFAVSLRISFLLLQSKIRCCIYGSRLTYKGHLACVCSDDCHCGCVCVLIVCVASRRWIGSLVWKAGARGYWIEDEVLLWHCSLRSVDRDENIADSGSSSSYMNSSKC